jgi:hypothetical protein
MTKTDLKPYDSLSIVTLDGFKSEPIEGIGSHDMPGSANWLCDAYGSISTEFDPDETGILWTDYDVIPNRPWAFTVLIDTAEVSAFRKSAEESGYHFVCSDEIKDAGYYGDGNGTVAILKHPDGWVVVS